MDIKITLTGAGIAEERIAAATRELLKDIRVDADPRARLVTRGLEPDSRGDVATFGQIALALVTGGAVAKLIESVFGFLGRNRKLVIEVQNADGQKLRLDMDFVDRHGTDEAIKLVESFLKKGE